ncbi:hypothetical protein F4815DRAFT_35429 [Daldinia loculata]|nr:hypothetical protein F4815DRAFT_35429 [Daldinia loculata]
MSGKDPGKHFSKDGKNLGGRPTKEDLANRLKAWPIRKSERVKKSRLSDYASEVIDLSGLEDEEALTQPGPSKAPNSTKRTSTKKAPRGSRSIYPVPPSRDLVQEADFESAMIPGEETNVPWVEQNWNESDRTNHPGLANMVKTPAWHEFWRSMVHIFHSTPHDLFTWGLCLGEVESSEIIRDLCELLPHPIWNGELFILRYAMQMAIALRTKSHMSPLCPLDPTVMDKIPQFRRPKDNDMSLEDRSSFALTLWGATKPDNGKETKNFFSKLREFLAGKEEAAENEREERVFRLRHHDVTNVRKVLDALYEEEVYRHDVRSYYNGYVMSTGPFSGDMAPTSLDTLNRWDVAVIRRKFEDWEQGQPDFPEGEINDQIQIAFWLSPSCDPRFKACILNDPLPANRGWLSVLPKGTGGEVASAQEGVEEEFEIDGIQFLRRYNIARSY